MNYVDILFIIIILLSAVAGWHKGFMISSMELVSWIGTFILTFILYPYVADLVEKVMPAAGIWISVVSLLCTLFLLRSAFAWLTYAFLKHIPEKYHQNIFNKITGIFPGIVSGGLFAIILTTLLLMLPFAGSSANIPRGAVLKKLSNKIEWFTEKMSSMFELDKAWPRWMVTVDPSAAKSIDLGFKITHVQARPDLEAKMLTLVNIERRKAGLDTLLPDTALMKVARKYSTDMFAKGYFSHFSPEGKSPFDRMREAHIKYYTAGENLAMAPTLVIAHDGLMNSPGHKANILKPDFGRVGIGVIEGGRHGLMISQEFRN